MKLYYYSCQKCVYCCSLFKCFLSYLKFVMKWNGQILILNFIMNFYQKCKNLDMHIRSCELLMYIASKIYAWSILTEYFYTCAYYMHATVLGFSLKNHTQEVIQKNLLGSSRTFKFPNEVNIILIYFWRPVYQIIFKQIKAIQFQWLLKDYEDQENTRNNVLKMIWRRFTFSSKVCDDER